MKRNLTIIVINILSLCLLAVSCVSSDAQVTSGGGNNVGGGGDVGDRAPVLVHVQEQMNLKSHALNSHAGAERRSSL